MLTDRFLFLSIPFTATLFLHGFVILILLYRWSAPAEVVASNPTMQPIRAQLVSLGEFKKSKEPEPNKAAILISTNPQLIVEPKVKFVPSPQTQAPDKTSVDRPASAPLVSIESKTESSANRLAIINRDEFERLIGIEESIEPDPEYTQRDIVAATIRGLVISKWTRPPSARNGMVCVLSIQLIPTGEVVGISVLKSSGNDAFDRSALSAVKRAGSFPDTSTLDDKEFEGNFRRFQLVFKPEDLRY